MFTDDPIISPAEDLAMPRLCRETDTIPVYSGPSGTWSPPLYWQRLIGVCVVLVAIWFLAAELMR